MFEGKEVISLKTYQVRVDIVEVAKVQSYVLALHSYFAFNKNILVHVVNIFYFAFYLPLIL
jgi:hypothetical protein